MTKVEIAKQLGVGQATVYHSLLNYEGANSFFSAMPKPPHLLEVLCPLSMTGPASPLWRPAADRRSRRLLCLSVNRGARC